MGVLTAATSTAKGVAPDTTYGLNVQQGAGDAAAADYAVPVQSYEISTRTLPDGEKIELQKPIYAFNGPVPAQFSVRQAPQVIGMGLLEAVAEPSILVLADSDDKNDDGVRGVPNWITNPDTGKLRLGRFGWKAIKASLRHQVSDALVKDMGVTSSVFPSPGCQRNAVDCKTAGTTPAVSDTEVQKIANYLSLIDVPAQHSLRSGYPDGICVSHEHDVNRHRLPRAAACSRKHSALPATRRR